MPGFSRKTHLSSIRCWFINTGLINSKVLWVIRISILSIMACHYYSLYGEFIVSLTDFRSVILDIAWIKGYCTVISVCSLESQFGTGN